MSKKITPPQLLVIPYVLIADDMLSPLDRIVYAVVYWFTHLKGERCFAGNSTIATIACCAESGVRKSLKVLEDAGYIERIYKGSKFSGTGREEIIPLIVMTTVKRRKTQSTSSLIQRYQVPDTTVSSQPDTTVSDNSNNNTKSIIITEQRDKEKKFNSEFSGSDEKRSLSGEDSVKTRASIEFEKTVADLIFQFKNINPNYKGFYRLPHYRAAISRMLSNPDIGEDLLRKVLRAIPKTNSLAFAPVITTPIELESKFASFIAFMRRQQAEKKSKGLTILNANEGKKPMTSKYQRIS